jgi:uncharacterized protein YsxB (DUF464 family)
MIRVVADHAEGELVLRAEGHATGRPEVCAAVSALTYTLAGWIIARALENAWPEGRWEARIDKGSACLRMPWTARSEHAFDLIRLGLEQVAAAAPDAVSVCVE